MIPHESTPADDPPPGPGETFSIPTLTLRAMFFLSAVGIAVYLARDAAGDVQFIAMLVAMAVSGLVIAVDALAITRSNIGTVSAIVFGLLIGFLGAQLFLGIVTLAGDFEGTDGKSQLNALRLVLTLIFCYLGPAYLLRTKDDFRFIVPYVEFRKQDQGSRPLILDTSAIIDGRIVDLARAHVFDAPFIVPRFVVDELQHLADQSARSRRERGRHGLERLKALQDTPGVEVHLVQAQWATGAVDRRLIEVSRARAGKLVTVDYNLQKVAELEQVPVINLNEISAGLRIPCLPGDRLQVRITRAGEGPQQGVGYLEDGTMVVVEGARQRKGQHLAVRVTSVIQSSAGRMVFARLDDGEPSEEGELSDEGPVAPAAAPAPAGGGGEGQSA